MELPTVKPAELKYSRDVSLDKGNGMKNHLLSLWQFAWDRAKSADTHKKKGCESESEKVKVRSSFQPVAMLLPCKKRKWTWESESEKQLPSCWHVVAMQKVKVNVRKWKWESAVAMQLLCWEAVSNLLPCKKWKWTWESESEKQFPSYCHAKKWKWESESKKQLPRCWHVVAMQKSENKCEKVKVRNRYTQKDWLSHFHFLTFTFLFSLFTFIFFNFTFSRSLSLSHVHFLTFTFSLSHFHFLTFTFSLSLKLCGSCHAVAMQLQDFAHIFCRTGKGIAAEVPKVVFVEMLYKI